MNNIKSKFFIINDTFNIYFFFAIFFFIYFNIHTSIYYIF